MTWGTPVRAAAYIRVSSKTQTFATQKAAIIQAATARGDTIGHFYEEKRSGNSLDRPKLAELQGDAQAGKVVKLYVFRIDRLTRRGIRDTLAIVEDFQRHGVTLVTVADGFDLEGPTAAVILAVMAWAAQMERQALGERISAARERVEAAGGRWGRPRRLDPGTLARAVKMRADKMTIREIAVALKIPRATLAGALSGKGHYAASSELGQKVPSCEPVR